MMWLLVAPRLDRDQPIGRCPRTRSGHPRSVVPASIYRIDPSRAGRRPFLVEIRPRGDMMEVMEVRLLVSHPSAANKQIRLGAETLIGRGLKCKFRNDV